MEPNDLFGDLGKREQEGECVLPPRGQPELRSLKKRITKIDGGLIEEEAGTCACDYGCCGCPFGAPDGGTCICGQRCCKHHASLCSVCGRVVGFRHFSILSTTRLPVCHECFKHEGSQPWIILIVIGLFALVLLGFLASR